MYRHKKRKNKTYGGAKKINPQFKITPKENKTAGENKEKHKYDIQEE